MGKTRLEWTHGSVTLGTFKLFAWSGGWEAYDHEDSGYPLLEGQATDLLSAQLAAESALAAHLEGLLGTLRGGDEK